MTGRSLFLSLEIDKIVLVLFQVLNGLSLITINGKERSIAFVVGFFVVDMVNFILLFFFFQPAKEKGQAKLKGVDRMKQQGKQ